MAVAPQRNKKWFLLFATVLLTTVLVMVFNRPYHYEVEEVRPYYLQFKTTGITSPNITVTSDTWRGLSKEEIGNLSTLGRILFLDEPPPKIRDQDKLFQILVWKYGPSIENRHLKSFSSGMVNPFEGCSVNNCEITYEDSAIDYADLVMFHLHRMKSVDDMPKRMRKDQIWAFLTDESPHHTFLSSRKNKLEDYDGLFNWSMTYRSDSDIPVPYGRTVLRENPFKTDMILNKRKDVLVAILGSNCGGNNNRWQYVKELKKHIQVDVYGGCGTLKTCPGHFKSNCHDIDSYLFYLAFENSNCEEYVTEKLWWNAYAKNSIPILMGASRSSYAKLLPPNSYLNVEDYARPQDLAQYIRYLNETGNFLDLYQWKSKYRILNEHGYFQSKSFHYCRVCEALNYNDKKPKTYEHLRDFWNTTKDCHPAWNAPSQ